MPQAIIADIHANLEALDAVLTHIELQGITKIVCLGDIVGYGPDPLLCVDLVRKKCSLALEGNHEEVIRRGHNEVYSSLMTDPAYKTNLLLYNQIMSLGILSIFKKRKYIKFFRNLPRDYAEENRYYVHASPLDKTWGYIFPKKLKESKRKAIFKKIENYNLCFISHAHEPYILYEDGSHSIIDRDSERFIFDNNGKLKGKRAIIGVGSVGQPRDNNPKACYVVLDNEGIQFHRVEYDYRKTQKGIMAIQELPLNIRKELARRLEAG